MQYNALKSIVGSRKVPVELQTASNSFFVKSTRVAPYIEPRFSKIEPLVRVRKTGVFGKGQGPIMSR